MRTQQGFTVVELMVAVVIVGILAAVVVPSFRADAAKGKSAEAKLELERLAHNAVVYFQEHRRFPQGTAAVLPGPDGDACNEKSRKFEVSTAWQTDSVWNALDFYVEEPARFSYHFETTSNKSARAWAVADLTCSGERVEYLVILEGRASGRVEWVLIDPSNKDVDLPEVEGDGEDFDGDNAGVPAAPGSEAGDASDDSNTGGGGSGGGSGSGSGSGGGLDSVDNDQGTGGGSTAGGSTGGGSTGGGASPTPTPTTPKGKDDDTTKNAPNGGGSTGGGSTGGSSTGGSTGGGSTGGNTNACGGNGGTTIITCPTGYTLHLASCSCKASK